MSRLVETKLGMRNFRFEKNGTRYLSTMQKNRKMRRFLLNQMRVQIPTSWKKNILWVKLGPPYLQLWGKRRGLKWADGLKRRLHSAPFTTKASNSWQKKTRSAMKKLWVERLALFWLTHCTTYSEDRKDDHAENDLSCSNITKNGQVYWSR